MTSPGVDLSKPGVLVHCLRAYTLHEGRGQSRVLTYGMEAQLLPEHFEAARDRNGVDALAALLDRPDGPLRRGPWPEGVDRILPGSPEWDEARTRALQAAAALPTEEEQRRAAAAARDRYGVHSSAKSSTLATYGDAR